MTVERVWPTYTVIRNGVAGEEPWYGDQTFDELTGAIKEYIDGKASYGYLINRARHNGFGRFMEYMEADIPPPTAVDRLAEMIEHLSWLVSDEVYTREQFKSLMVSALETSAAEWLHESGPGCLPGGFPPTMMAVFSQLPSLDERLDALEKEQRGPFHPDRSYVATPPEPPK